MNNTLKFSRNLMLAMGLLLAAGTAQAADPIKIGVITDRVGNSAAWAKPIEQGMEMAVNEINAAGGVLGRQLNCAMKVIKVSLTFQRLKHVNSLAKT